MQLETLIRCDIRKPVQVQYINGVVFSQDAQANVITVNCFDGEDPATVSGTVTANIIRSDGGTVTATGGTASGNTVSITLPAAAYAVPGLITVAVKVTSGSTITTVGAIVANVYRSTTDTPIDPGTIIPSVQTLIADIDAAVASIPADYSTLWTTLAPAYSNASAYAVGDYVTYNGGLYRCTTAIASGETWTAAHWTAATVGAELSAVKNALEETTGRKVLDMESGYIDTKENHVDINDVVSSDSYVHVVDSCSKGDIYFINGYGAAAARLWCFVNNATGLRLTYASSNVDTGGEFIKLVAPENATHFIMNAKTAYFYQAFKVAEDAGTPDTLNIGAEVNALKSAISAIGTDIDTLENTVNANKLAAGFDLRANGAGYTEITDIVQGVLDVSGVEPDSKRLSIGHIVPVYRGMILDFTIGTLVNQYLIKKYDTDMQHIADIIFRAQSMQIDYDGFAIIVMRNNNEADVSVSAYDATIKLRAAWEDVTYNNRMAAETIGGFNILPANLGYIQTSGASISIPPEIVNSSAYKYIYTSCVEGDVFYIKGYGAAAARLWAFADAEGSILSASASNVNTNGESIIKVAPKDAAYFVCNVRVASPYAVGKLAVAFDPVISWHFLPAEFEPGYYNPTSYVFTRNSIVTKNWIDSSIISVIANGTNVRMSVVYRNKTTGVQKRVQDLNDGAKYVFDHNTYLYKIYLQLPAPTSGDQTAKILDYNDVLQYIVYQAPESYVDGHVRSQIELLNDGKIATEKANQYLSNFIGDIRHNTDYNISYANAASPLSLITYAGNNQMVHPKVLYFENGWNGHKFWMGYTPYPFGDEVFENPCIAYSDDGYTWENIDGNPIAYPSVATGVNTDIDLVYRADTGVMECWYRYGGPDRHEPENETIKRKTSTDGVTWSAEEIIRDNDSGYGTIMLSPSVLVMDNKYCIWVVNSNHGSPVIDYYEAPLSDVTNWTLIRSINLSYTCDGTVVEPWHMDAIYEDNKYILCVMCRNGRTGNVWPLFITTSTDNINYETPYVVVKGSNNWDEIMYRSSIVKVGDIYRIYYTGGGDAHGDAANAGVTWGIGITESNTLSNFYGCMKIFT